MKKLMIIAAIFATFYSCNMKEQTTQAMLKSPKMQEEIMDGIVADSSLSARMLDRLMEDNRSRVMMLHHNKMSRMMCTAGRLDSMAKADREMNELMMSFVQCRIDQDTAWCNRLSKMLEGKSQ